MLTELIFPRPPHKAIRNDLDVVLEINAIPWQEADDGCHHRDTGGGDFPHPWRKHDGLTNGEFVGHRRPGLVTGLLTTTKAVGEALLFCAEPLCIGPGTRQVWCYYVGLASACHERQR